MKRLALVAAFCLLAGIGGAFADGTRLSVPLQGRVFNSASSDYTTRPTFVLLEKPGKKDEHLMVEVERYSPDQYGLTKIYTRLQKNSIDDYLAMIEKYFAWETLALERGDALSKEIGKAKTINGNLKFSFHSGNAKSHYLEVRFCAFGTCVEDAPMFDHDGAEQLKALLNAWKAGHLKPLNVDDVYK